MNRLLLALLALLAGLATQTAPAQARIGSGQSAEIGVVESGRSASPAPVQSQSATDKALRQERREREASRVRPRRSAVLIPAVFYGTDRALE